MDADGLRTDYPRHDEFYRAMRERGATGWHTAHEMAAMIADLDRALSDGAVRRAGAALELGCGAGEMTVWLAGQGFRPYGVDIAPAAIRWARDRAAETGLAARLGIADVRSLPFRDDAFDVVVDGACLHCIIGRHRQAVLAEAFRVLTPDGLFYVQSMCAADDFDGSRARHYDAESRCVVIDGVAARYVGTPDGIASEVARAGFRIERRVERQPAGGFPFSTVLLTCRPFAKGSR